MALADWLQYQIEEGEFRTLELRSDKVYEGSKALFIDADEFLLIHKQTLIDKPKNGALKTYFLFPKGKYSIAGAVFKADRDGNGLVIKVFEGGRVELWEAAGSTMNWMFDSNLDYSLSEETWFILEIICDDDNGVLTVRAKDKDENVLGETIVSSENWSSWRGISGGIGLYAEGTGIYYDLTKIYYP